MARTEQSITVAVPEQIVKLTPEQKNRLRKTFRTTVANEVSTIAEREISKVDIENVKPRRPITGAAKARKATAAKKRSKK